jgi:hypothetical protein
LRRPPRGGIVAAMGAEGRTPRRWQPGRGIAGARGAAALLAAGLALIAAGCGRPASRAECEEIFQRSVEIELRAQNVTDPKLIAERSAAVRAARGEDLIARCVGRRITERAIGCVRQANSPEAMDRCLQ